MSRLAAWPLLLVAAMALIIGGWRYAVQYDENAVWIVAVGVLLLGCWTALEVQRLSGLRQDRNPWPGDTDDGGGDGR